MDHTPINSDFLPPAFTQRAVPVVFAANNGFVPMFAVCLQSLLEHSSPQYNYDVVLLQSDVTAENRAVLLGMTAGYPNVSLRFFDAAPLVADYGLRANAHISVETYYRFLIQAVLPAYDKVLYLDCDLILCADAAELYQEELDGYMLAAVRDADFLGQINGANEETRRYIQTDFCMRNPYDYFQAGVLLFNEAEMRRAHTLDEWLRFASVPYKYNDQDVLNLRCEGRVKYLDMAWNVLSDCNHTRVSQVIAFAPAAVRQEYEAARRAPKIIHYAGFRKPWHSRGEDFADRFWDVAGRTPYYDLLRKGMEAEERRRNSLARRTADRLFPLGTARREWLKRLLGRGR